MTDIPARLTDIHAALVEKIGGQPTIPPSMSIRQSGQCDIALYPPKIYEVLHYAKGNSPEACIADALAFIAKMPTAEARAKHEWHGKLGKVIDEGHALALPDDVMTPLRASSQAMSKNLLAAPEAAE